MATVIEGTLQGAGVRVAIVASRFNELVVERLVGGAIEALRRCGVGEDGVTVFRTPGAFEIPQVARLAAASGRHDAVICLGAVIRGGTPHFDYVCSACTSGVAAVARDADVPVIYGVLTCDSVEQALDRAGVKAGNKGADAAMAAIEMVTLLRAMRGQGQGGRGK